MEQEDREVRLINADDCERYFYEHLDDNGMVAALNAINEMPTVNVPERNVGKWVKTGQSFVFPNKFKGYSCSCCGYYIDKEKPLFLFCPYCGADMRDTGEESVNGLLEKIYNRRTEK